MVKELKRKKFELKSKTLEVFNTLKHSKFQKPFLFFDSLKTLHGFPIEKYTSFAVQKYIQAH